MDSGADSLSVLLNVIKAMDNPMPAGQWPIANADSLNGVHVLLSHYRLSFLTTSAHFSLSSPLFFSNPFPVQIIWQVCPIPMC